MKKAMAFIFLSLILASVLYLPACSGHRPAATQPSPPPETAVVHDSMFRSLIIRTHTIERDSVITASRGDTVFIRSSHWQSTSDAIHDTVRITLRDTIRVPYPVYVDKPIYIDKPVEVEKPLSWWQFALQWLGILFLIMSGIIIWQRVRH